ncbi:hypothetical protein [Streptomyces spongiae]|uniref:Uncharacterized protein n=1 Tax=Streptomyces spongiae TaxID=565072 RepID=A0A5N8XEV5_9ACTN|nr:hypothetical protein [Streptomyces spongiae]MPY57734.1 hypothetical protein [Streptomyces spongiae]
MPRRRPQRPRGGAHDITPVIDGLSARALSEIARLERTRNHLWPGDVATALRLWRDCVQSPARGQWHAYEFGNDHWDCCGDPFEARMLLDSVLHALAREAARELRRLVDRLDARWIPPERDVG